MHIGLKAFGSSAAVSDTDDLRDFLVNTINLRHTVFHFLERGIHNLSRQLRSSFGSRNQQAAISLLILYLQGGVDASEPSSFFRKRTIREPTGCRGICSLIPLSSGAKKSVLLG